MEREQNQTGVSARREDSIFSLSTDVAGKICQASGVSLLCFAILLGASQGWAKNHDSAVTFNPDQNPAIIDTSEIIRQSTILRAGGNEKSQQEEAGTLPQYDIYQVVEENEAANSGNFITRFFKRIKNGLSRKQEPQKPDPNKAESGPFYGPFVDESADVASSSAESEYRVQQESPTDSELNNSAESKYKDLSNADVARFSVAKDKDAENIDDEPLDSQRQYQLYADTAIQSEQPVLGKSWRNFGEALEPAGWEYTADNYGLELVEKSYSLYSKKGFSLGVYDLYYQDRSGQNINNAADGETVGRITQSSPNLVLEWNAGGGEQIGSYRFSALSRMLQTEGDYQGRQYSDESFGWGVNLEGGWRFGSFRAGFSFAMGEGVDSLLLPYYGEDIYENDEQLGTRKTVSIIPSLSYDFNDKSRFQLALGRYQNSATSTASEDTLDTVHLGYSWSAWPDSQLGIEFVDQKVDGDIGNIKTDKQIRFGIRRDF